MDDTRDIAIATRTEVKHLSEQVTSLLAAVAELKKDLNERNGMEKLARALYGVIGGVFGVSAAKVFTWLVNVPIK